MRIFFVSFLLLFLFFSAQIYAVEIDSVKIGWGDEGYYRIGYFTPAQIRLKSDSDFEGTITIKTDNLSYSKDLKIPKDSTEIIRFDILILSLKPNIEIILGDLPPYITSNLSIQNVYPNKFLIAVERPYLEIFREEFTRKYPDAAKKSKFVAFQTDELSNEFQSYESLDLAVLSSANLPASVQNALYGWSTYMGGIVLYKLGDIGDLSQLFNGKKSPYSENPCINPDIYRKISQQLIPTSAKKILVNYILIYGIITLIILFLLVLLKNSKKIIVAIIIVITIAIFLLYTFYLPLNPITETHFFGDTNELFIRILDYSPQNNMVLKKMEEDTSLIKPIYKDMESMINTKIHYYSDKEFKDTIKIEFPNNSQDKTFIFQVCTVRK